MFKTNRCVRRKWNLVVHYIIRWCKDLIVVLPRLTKDYIIILLIFVPAEGNRTIGHVYLYHRSHISLFRNFSEIIT